MSFAAGGVEHLAGLMPLFLLVLHLMHRRADGCLAAKSVIAHASANSTFEKKSLSVHRCWAFRGTIHLQHIELELDLLFIHHLLPGGSSPPSNVDVSNYTPSLHHLIHREQMENLEDHTPNYLVCISIIQITNTTANGMVTGNEGMIVS